LPLLEPRKCSHPERSAAEPKDPHLSLPLLSQLLLPLPFFLSFPQGICCCPSCLSFQPKLRSSPNPRTIEVCRPHS
jgi:hypothetical protein